MERMGVYEEFAGMAGPEVREVGLAAGKRLVTAPLPKAGWCAWGRALSRERLDTLLLSRAANHGAVVFQPYSAVSIGREGEGFTCTVRHVERREEVRLRARVVIAAHGSWEPGALPTQHRRTVMRPGDLLAFKGHFTGTALPESLMPLVLFRDGYAGLVHCDGGRVSASCCIRWDRLERIRRQWPGLSAAEATFEYVPSECAAMREWMRSARREGPLLAAGPIRPGIRGTGQDGLFLVGNAAGEPQPAIAEGITMAMQSSWLLCRELIARRGEVMDGKQSRAALGEAGEAYARQWRRYLAPRIRVASVFANVGMRPIPVAAGMPIVRAMPSLLTLGARLAGKATRVA
jgi:flavin-dependent dehydrogenase